MKRFVINLIKYLLIPFGVLLSCFRRNRNSISILMYHRVNDSINKELSVTLDNFIWQMDYIKAKGYKVISMDEVFDEITSGSISGKQVVLTFDDGYEDFYDNAYPILRTYNYKSTLYIVPGFIETDRVFWWDEDLKESRLMNWQQINELSQSGLVTVGSHTNSHTDLNKLNLRELEQEISQSKETIGKKINRPVRHFCYPRGLYPKEGAGLIGRIYDTAVLMSNGVEVNKKLEPGQLIKLKRIPVQRGDGKYFFIARLKGWLFFEELLRKLKTSLAE